MVFNKYKLIIQIAFAVVSVLPQSLCRLLLVVFRSLTGYLGIGIRYVLVKRLARSCGDNVIIKEHVIFDAIHLMDFGNNVSINPFCYIAGEVSFGNDISVAHTTAFHSANHTWDLTKVIIDKNPVISNRIFIDNDVWIGCNCVILSGVKLSMRCVVGAGSIVTKGFDKNVLIAGNPAKVVKNI